MIEAKVSDKDKYLIKALAKGVEVNGVTHNPDIVRLEDGSLHMILDNQSFTLRLISADRDSKSYRVSVNNQEIEVSLKDDTDLLLDRLGLSAAMGSKLNELKAPMPGLVLKVLVEPGQQVKKGDSLIVLEAMKMENVIKAAGEGVVKQVKVAPQTKVEKNFILIEFE